jgi:adenosylcobinamide kinase/adenosylcobinamide-phosphate guanylyltransferase
MGRITLVLGGARSGKSEVAERLAAPAGRGIHPEGIHPEGDDGARKVAYIATSLVLDDEMRERVRIHRARRPQTWRTYEQATDLDLLVRQLAKEADVILIDCALMYVSNLFFVDEEEAAGPVVKRSAYYRASEARIDDAINRLLAACEAAPDVIIVSGEVGCGIVPENALARRFRDIMGLVNQRLAERADEVYSVTAGIPVRIKAAEAPDPPLGG